MTTARVARGFDRLAPCYDLAGSLLFAGALHRSQTLWLPTLAERPVARALVPGGGTGRFAVELLAAVEVGELWCVDPSAAMSARTRRRLAGVGASTRVHTVQGTLADLQTPPCDLICLNYFLDLFDEAALELELDRIDALAAPEARCLVTDFAPGDGWLLRSLYAFFRATCGIAARRLPDIDGALERRGWRATGCRAAAGGRMLSTLWSRGGVSDGSARRP